MPEFEEATSRRRLQGLVGYKADARSHTNTCDVTFVIYILFDATRSSRLETRAVGSGSNLEYYRCVHCVPIIIVLCIDCHRASNSLRRFYASSMIVTATMVTATLNQSHPAATARGCAPLGVVEDEGAEAVVLVF